MLLLGDLRGRTVDRAGHSRDFRLMATINVSLPDELKSYVEGQVAGGFYLDVSDFVRAAIREHKESLDRLDALIQDGIDSGWSDLSFDEAIAQARENARSRAA